MWKANEDIVVNDDDVTSICGTRSEDYTKHKVKECRMHVKRQMNRAVCTGPCW